LRDLHSFPTRRSSDLFFDSSVDALAGFVARQAVEAGNVAKILARGQVIVEPDAVRQITDTCLDTQRLAHRIHPQNLDAPGAGFGDRKSTRLNSSHVKI